MSLSSNFREVCIIAHPAFYPCQIMLSVKYLISISFRVHSLLHTLKWPRFSKREKFSYLRCLILSKFFISISFLFFFSFYERSIFQYIYIFDNLFQTRSRSQSVRLRNTELGGGRENFLIVETFKIE